MPRDSALANRATRRTALSNSSVFREISLSWSRGMTSSYFGKCPSTSTLLIVAAPVRMTT